MSRARDGAVRRAKRAVAAHTKPCRVPEWCKLPPSSPYACKAKHIGAQVPGRNGGRVVACATPARRGAEGQYWVKPPRGAPHALRKSLVRDRLRNQKRGAIVTDPLDIVWARVEAAREADHIPGPVGAEFPHRAGSLEYDAHHPLWDGWEDAVRAAEAEALDVYGDGEGYGAGVLEILARDPRFDAWRAAEQRGVRAFRDRQAGRAGKATFSTARESARARRAAELGGVDLTSAEYLDTLSPSGRAKALRRMGRVAEARDLERDMRRRAKRRAA